MEAKIVLSAWFAASIKKPASSRLFKTNLKLNALFELVSTSINFNHVASLNEVSNT